MSYFIFERPDKIIETDRETFTKWINDPKLRILLQDGLENGLFLSTVFLGLDHAHGGPEPILFETAILDRDYNDLHMKRHKNYQTAAKYHYEVLNDWKKYCN